MKKRSIVLCVLIVLVLTMAVGTVGAAFADEIRINLIGNDFSNEEKQLAIANLELKFADADEQMPTLKSVEALYDFNEQPLYGLYEFVDYYMIVIRQTSSILERGKGNSIYFEIEGKKYYGGVGEAYLSNGKNFKSLLNKDKIATDSEIEEMKNRMSELRALDYQDYIEALNTPMPLGQGNRLRITALGKSNKDFNYFANDVNIDHWLEDNPSGIKSKYFGNLYTYDGASPQPYGKVYMRNFDYGADLFYPQNVYNACSLVAMTMVLQYYERMGYRSDLIASNIGGKGLSMSDIENDPLISRAERIRAKLDNYLNVLQIGSSAVDGAATYRDINYGFKDYFEANNIDCAPTHFTTYTNMKGAIDDGNPVIMTVGWGPAMTRIMFLQA